MTTTFHPRDQLSAYRDGAQVPAERAVVEAHLTGCAECRARLAELSAVAAAIVALPDPVPSRRLVPRLTTAPSWIAPLRTVATLASGLSVFLFMASAILANVGWLAQGGATTAGRAAAPMPVASAGAVQDAARSPQWVSAKSAVPASPAASAFAAQGAAAQSAAEKSAAEKSAASGFRVGPSPWVWLALAVLTGALALALHRRLRSA